VKQGEETVTISLRVTVAQREKLARLGGAEWVRGKIDRAKEPNAELCGGPSGPSERAPGYASGGKD
jgi:hypothetical protein